MKKIIIILSFLIFTSANAGMSDNDKSKAWDCVGIYMANYFLPSGEKFEYGMKEKSISTVKVLKTYALEIGIPEKDWDAGVNIAGAIRLGKLLGPGKTIVTILCDKSDKYNSKMFNKTFLKEKNLPIPSWL